MTEEKYLSGRGGKREGAGRPRGSIKENKKKPVSFKLSESEEKVVRAVLKDMRTDDMFKYEKQVELETSFKPLILELQRKYENALHISIHYDCIFFEYKGDNIKDTMLYINDKLIKWAANELDEEYYLILENPAEISISPYNRTNILYQWLLNRKLKDEENNEE